MIILLVLLGIWLLLNAGYVLRNQIRIANWEKEIDRNANGVLRGAEPFRHDVEGAETAILLVHGYANSPDLWRHMQGELIHAGYSVMAIQLPGFMVPARQAQTTQHAWLDALTSAVAELRTEHKRVWVMSHSLGCAITLAALHGNQVQLDGMVFFAPLIEVSSARSPLFPPRSWQRFGKGLLFAPRVLENVFPPDITDKKAGANLLQDRFIHRSVHDSLFAITGSLPDSASFVTVPMLVFIAPNDTVVDVDRIEHYIRTASGPVKRVEATGAGHVVPIDIGWEKHLQTAVEFIRQQANYYP